ncbi:hypothetical protein GCM10010344_41210 [Streptomyces bluensis]|nr:hypothetical protein GCM10010344_41210 [Streptomyces bluensis]
MDAYVPLLQTLAWVLLIACVVVAFRKPLKELADVIVKRVKAGAGVEAGVSPTGPYFKLNELREKLPRYEPEAATEAAVAPAGVVAPAGAEPLAGDDLPEPVSPSAREVWERYRDQLKERSHRIHLVHVISPSTRPGQRFDLFIYLKAAMKGDLADVKQAQFFLGRHWGNKVFASSNQDGLIGFSTSAWGSTLCVCRIVFKDGSHAVLSRYLDFEMAPVFDTGTLAAP